MILNNIQFIPIFQENNKIVAMIWLQIQNVVASVIKF